MSVLVALAVVGGLLLGVWGLLDEEASGDGSAAVIGVRETDSGVSMRVPDVSGDAGTQSAVPLPDAPAEPQRLVVDAGVLVVEAFVAEGLSEPMPVSGATVAPVVRAVVGTPRTTDDDGRVEVPRLELLDAAITVRKPGFFPAVADPRSIARLEPDGRPLRVELIPAFPLFGRLESWSGSPPVPEGVAVLAWSRPEWPTRDEVFALLQRERGLSPDRPPAAHERTLLLTRTKPGGAFRFPTPVRGKRWMVMAAGAGYLTADEVAVRPAAKKAVVLDVMNAFSMAVQITDHVGSPLPPHADLYAFTAEPVGLIGGHVHPFNEVERLLLGIETPEGWEPVHYADILKSGEKVAARLAVSRPGFEKLSEPKGIPSTREGPVLHTMSLTPTWEPLGELTLELPGWGELVAGLAEEPIAVLVLMSLQPPGHAHGLNLITRDIRDDRVLLTELRHGVYITELQFGSMGSDWPSPPVTISSHPATLEIDLTTHGTLEIDVLDAEGRPYDGPLQVLLQQDREGIQHSRFSTNFQRPPYQEPLVEAGLWTLSLSYSDNDTDWTGFQAPAETVEVLPGRWTRTTLVLGKP